ncbi:hypothetical protein QYM36_015520, partial [Artemia franciscana]
FLTRLTLFYVNARERKPSLPVTLVMKRYDGRTKPTPKNPEMAEPPPEEYKCLYRAQLRKQKISTV